MNPSSQIAIATGSMSIVTALGISLGWFLGIFEIKATAEQAGALGILMFPFIQILFMKIGASLDDKQPKDRRSDDKANGEVKAPTQ